ncbi:MAG TPA: hypothetical protein VMY77_08210 [Chitinophagaceae bacterium]|nr:hypothetical protein [Chitinophagaceae bacterium]
MEVHKHPHHVTHKKKWTEYLLEFFMLFLAVFLGFLVENFREHKVELERTEKHMHTMVENLKYDTTRYGRSLRTNLETAKHLDSFRYQINEAIGGKIDPNKLYYYYFKYGGRTSSAVPNPSAMTQLKSSGMLRMIKNDALAAEISDYYERYYYGLETGRERMLERAEQAYQTYRSVFSYQGLEVLLQRDTTYITSVTSGPGLFVQNYAADILTRNPPLKLLPTATANFQRLYEDVAAFELSMRGYNARLRFCHEGADSLMKHIKQEYNFKDE